MRATGSIAGNYKEVGGSRGGGSPSSEVVSSSGGGLAGPEGRRLLVGSGAGGGAGPCERVWYAAWLFSWVGPSTWSKASPESSSGGVTMVVEDMSVELSFGN